MAFFEKNPRAPLGDVTVTVAGFVYVVRDGLQTEVRNRDAINTMLITPSVQLVGTISDDWVIVESPRPLYYLGDPDSGEVPIYDGAIWAPGPQSGGGGGGAPSGPAGGDLSGTYPNPGIAAGVIVAADISSTLKPSGSAAAGTEALRALGTSSSTAAAGDDSRLTDSRAPRGTAGGDLSGTYPNPTLAAGAVGAADLADLAVADRHVSASAAIALSKLATNPVARANHTGTQLAATISDFDTQVRTSTLAQMAAPGADVAWNSRKITGLLDPTSAQDAATKTYVDRRTIVTRSLHGFGFIGAVTAQTLPGFFIDVAASETVRIVGVRYVLQSGTSASFRLQNRGSDITGFGTSGSPLSATTTAGSTAPTGVSLAAADFITCVISAVSGSPVGLSATVILEHTITVS